jgi:hypothetical protein
MGFYKRIIFAEQETQNYMLHAFTGKNLDINWIVVKKWDQFRW